MQSRARGDQEHEHHHRDVSGGWLRPTVFGAMDGLVTNVSLIAGVGGSGAAHHTVVLTGLAGLVAGAFSMATGEYISVSSQNELVEAEVEVERLELRRHPEAERRELVRRFEARGVRRSLAEGVVDAIAENPEEELRLHAQEELGVDPTELPSPWVAALSSFASFAVGAVIPLLPYLAGAPWLWLALAVSAVALFAGGATVARLTSRPVWYGGARQLALGALAAGATYGVGVAIGTGTVG
ncbi:MAG: VIT1/CCC1 transporter family protein [Frankiaceae bacterium]